MLKKQRLAAMEGKRHDALPAYSRKGRTSAKDSYDPASWQAWDDMRSGAGETIPLATVEHGGCGDDRSQPVAVAPTNSSTPT